ncbi:hypothetical protein VFPPC_18677 [Pochonia chlamydosporia 170]|uniref:Uncharacterized protein n=1 Tax=Pochonia chlamydosporia 170 TaxID=1380566 RepID=A0A219AS45_METCM|nr:hypothetical protein VFPPC_18677 [Pochonia chlamydosporia 170]OWT43596.1 hypothetical protein VFPPC_18677 [Pochonia chlamydosporia 170]
MKRINSTKGIEMTSFDKGDNVAAPYEGTIFQHSAEFLFWEARPDLQNQGVNILELLNFAKERKNLFNFSRCHFWVHVKSLTHCTHRAEAKASRAGAHNESISYMFIYFV